jgi:hypothetical protein
MKTIFSRSLLFITLLCLTTKFYSQLAPSPTLATTNVTEASQYGVLYQLDIPVSTNYANLGSILYSINNSSLNLNYSRIAYFLQLDSKWVWVSMNKFNSTNTELGVPFNNSGIIWQQIVTGMNVYSSVGAGVTNTTGISGNIEIWPDCYNAGVGLGGIGGSAANYDFNDTRSPASNCYGSFQVHNYDASQTIFALNRFVGGGGNIDLGIGNNTGNANPDWTFMSNANAYTTRKLWILVESGINFINQPSTTAQNACINGTVSPLTVSTSINSGTLTSYQWYSNTASSNTGGTLVATNTTSLTTNSYTPSTSAAGTLYYYCIANGTGSLSALSNVSGAYTTGNPTLTITGTGSICAGGSITLSAASSTGASTFTWSTGQTTSSIIVTPSATANYSVSGTSTLGCIGGSSISSVTVNPIPIISVTNGTICNGNSFVLSPSGASTYTFSGGQATVAPTANTNYTVSGTSTAGCIGSNTLVSVVVNTLPIVSISGTNAICNGASASLTASGANTYTWNTGSNSAGISVSPTISASYSLSGSSSQGCVSSSSAVITITVNALPTINITGANTICAGSSLSLNAGGASTYTWNTNANTALITVTPSVNTSYSVSGTNSAGCVSSTSAVTTVTVNSLPVVSITGTNTICSGTSATLTASGASTYTWNTASNSTSIFVSPTITTNYSVSGTNSVGCISNTQAVISLSVNSLPMVSISGTNAMCFGNTISLAANGAATYTWSNGSISGGVFVSPTVTTTYSLSGTSSVGCISASPATTTITVNALPIISITGANTVCLGSSLGLAAGGASTYTWNTNANTALITVTPIANTSYSVSGTSSAGCVSSTSAVTTVSVNSLPVVSISGVTVICEGTSTNLTASGASTYTWNTSASTTSITVSPTTNTVYTVLGTNSLGCVSATSAALSFSVKPAPILSTIGGTLICAGGASSLIASGATTYTWVGIGSGNPIGVFPTVTTSYTLTGTNSDGCQGTPVVKTISVNPSPTVSISGTNTAICAGTTISLTASGANTYTWTGLGSSTVIAVSPTTTISYMLGGTNSFGCTSYASKTVTVNALPSLTISGSSGICTGQNASLTVSGANSYSWSTGSTSNSIVTTPTANTVYTISGTDLLGCVNTSTQLVTVASSLSISINSPTVICSGEPLNLSALGGATYTWNTGAITTSIVLNPTVTTTYSVIGASGTCSNTALKTIVVNPNPTVSISGPTGICDGESITLTASGATSYTWSNTSNTASVTLTPTATTVYSVTGEYTTGCSAIAINTITVYSLPTLSISGPSAVCVGGSAILTASGANTYSWSTGVFTNTISLIPTNTSTYSAMGTDANGCTNVSSLVTVTVNPIPTLTIVSSATEVCSGTGITLTANGATSYLWNGTATTSIVNFTPNVNTSYSVVGTNSFACSSSTVILITVNALPTIAITGSTLICIGETTILNVSGANTYTWNGGNNTTSLIVTPTISTSYSVSGTNAKGCKANSNIKVNLSDCTGLTSVSANSKISLYPNPTSGNLTLELLDPTDATITIRNILGQLVMTKKAELITNISLNDFNNGMYYITITKNNTVIYNSSIIKN